MPLALRSTESDELLSFVRENYPDYDDVPDDELRKRLAAKPQGLVRAIRSKYADAYMHLDDERLTERVVAKLEGRLPKTEWGLTKVIPPVKHLLTGALTSPQSQATLAKTYGQFPADVASVVGETVESFATPANVLLGMGLSKASPAVRGATSATFGAEALNSIRLQYPQLRQAIDEERWGDAAKEALRLGLYSAFALFMGKHAKAQTKLYQPPKAVLAGAPKAVPFEPPAPETIKAAETVAATRRVAGAQPIEVPSPEKVAAAERVRTQRLDAAHAEQAKVTTRIRELEEVKKQRQDAGDRSGADDAERQLKPLREQHGEQQLTLSRLEGRGLPKPVPAEEPVEAPPPTPITELTKRAEEPEPQPQGPSDAELADLPFAAATEPRVPTPPEEKGLPKWVSENIDTLNDEAVNAGVADDIETLSAQRLTAGQIAKTLSVEKATVYAVRAKRGIPSMDSKTEFETWLRDRQAPPSDAARGMTTRPKQAGEVLTSDELRPEVRERIIVRGALTQLSDTLDDMRGQVGIYRSEVAGGKPDEWTGIKSPLPKELQQGFKWDEIQRIIKKGLAGEKLTPRQRAYFNDLSRWAKKKGGQVGPEDVAELIAKHDLPLKSELEPEPEPDTSFPFGANAPEQRQPTVPRPGLGEVELQQPGAPPPSPEHPFVETPSGDVVKPNPPADPSLRALADEQIEQLAGSTNDQKIGEALAKLMGVERPVVVTRGDIMVAQTTSSTGMHQIVLPQQAGASTLYHEMRHAAANEGKGPPVTENTKDLELGEFLSQQEARKRAAGLPPPPRPPAPGAPPPSGGELPKMARSINLNRVNSVDDIKQQILEDAEGLPEHKTLTLEEAAHDALQNGMTIADEVKFSKSYKQTHNKVMRARNAALASYERFNAAARALQDAPQETPELLDAMRVAFNNRLAAVQAWNDIAHEAGLTLSLFRTQVEPFAAQAKMAKAVDKLLAIVAEKGKLSDEIVRRAGLLNWESPREVQTFLQHLSPLVSSKPDKVFEWYINSLLSGPKTQEANTLGNMGSSLGFRPLTQALTGAAEQVRGAMRGETPRAFGAEALYRFKGAFSSLKDAARVFVRTMGSEVSESGLSKFGETTRLHGPAIEGRLRVGGEPVGPNFGRAIRLPGTFLKAADDFFRVVGQRAGKYSYLYREGRQNGLRDAELDRYVLEEANKPHPEIDAQVAAETTEDLYQSPLGKAGDSLMHLRDDTWVGRFVAPFLRIGVNLPRYQFGYTGPGNLFKLWYQARKGRLPGGPQMTYELAKVAVGSTLAMWVVNEAASGNLTGGGPSDYRQRREWENSGWQPYSKRNKDGSYSSYARTPAGIMVGVMADLAEILNLIGEAVGRGDLDAKQAETLKDTVIGKSVGMVANNITNQTFLKGVSDMFEIGHDPEQRAPRVLGQFVGAMVAPTIVANVAEALDPYVREARTFTDQIKKRIPVARQSLPVMRDIRGRPIEAAGSPVTRMFNIFQTRQPRGGKVQKKIMDLGIGWDRLDRVFNIKNNRIELSNDEYDEFNETSGRRVDLYLRALEPEETWTAFNRLSQEQQADTIKKMVEKGRREGKDEFKKRHLAEWMREGRVR